MLRLIKLVNGTELVGDIDYHNNTHIVVNEPLQINYKQRVDLAPPTVYLHRYSPFSKTRQFTFASEHILNMDEPLQIGRAHV